MSLINIKLGKEKKLFHPANQVLMKADKVYSVQSNTFWNRRLKDGDVILATKPKSESNIEKNK